MHRRALTASLLAVALLSGCTTTTPGTAAPNGFEAQEYAACHKATDKAAGAIRAFLVQADTNPLNVGDPDVEPIQAMTRECRSGRVEGMADLIVKVSDGFTPTTRIGQAAYQGLLGEMCSVPGIPVEDMRARAQAVCAGR